MKKYLMMVVAAMMSTLSVQAQDSPRERMDCLRRDGVLTRAESYDLPEPYDFDPQTTYHQPVVLISFNDQDFSMDDPKGYYDRLLNENGFNGGNGVGCAAEYFREQSGGRLNLQFDIYGPFKVDENAGGHGFRFFGDNIMKDALKQLYETETTDFSIYDWDHKSAWANNMVNTSDIHYRYDLFHADGKAYSDWDPYNNASDPSRYTMPDEMRSSYLSTSPYPYTDPVSLVVNNSLTDTSLPSAILYNAAANGRKFMGKSITNIQLAADGTISFDFMKVDTGIKSIEFADEPGEWYTLDGRCLSDKPTVKGIYLFRSNAAIKRGTPRNALKVWLDE